MNSIATTTIHISAKSVNFIRRTSLLCHCACWPDSKNYFIVPIKTHRARAERQDDRVCDVMCCQEKKHIYKVKESLPLCSGYVHISHPPCSINQQHKRISKGKIRNRREQRAEEKKLKLGEKNIFPQYRSDPPLGLGLQREHEEGKKNQKRKIRGENENSTQYTHVILIEFPKRPLLLPIDSSLFFPLLLSVVPFCASETSIKGKFSSSSSKYSHICSFSHDMRN